jgi:hypothetical protein
MTTAKVQHYVPQFLLRNFGNGKKDQVWVYDKTTGRAFSTNAKNVASESRFYDFVVEGEAVTLEPMLSKLESTAKPIIEKILETDSLASLDEEKKAMLASFLSVQRTRTRTFREQWNDFPKLLREHLESRGEEVAEGSQAAQLLIDFTENESKAETGRLMLQAPEQYAPHLLSKQWALASTTRKHPFLISDNPLTLQNMNHIPGRGNLGFAVRGIEIYFPLSPTRALALWCPSIVELLRQEIQKYRERPWAFTDPGLSGDEGPIALLEAINTGKALAYSKENVENFNSLQISHSERYVFSSTDDFHLAKDMLKSHPQLKRGPRTAVVS